MVVPFRFNALGLRPHDLFQYYGLPQVFSVVRLWTPDLVPLDRWGGGRLYPLQSLFFGLVSALYVHWRFADATLLYTRDPRVAWWLGLLSKAPFIYEANDLFPSTKRGQQAVLALARSPSCLGIVVVNHILGQRYIEEIGMASEKIIVAPNGVDLKVFENLPPREEARGRLDLPLDSPIVGYIGRFHTLGMEKGISELIRAMAIVSKVNEQEPLLLCVGGPMEVVPAYRQLARQVGVPERRLHFVDRVPNWEVPFWIRAFDVATMPFPHTEHYAYFMSPLKLFEYMAAGMPIVASDLPALREVLRHGENAWLVMPGDPEALAEGLAILLRDSALSARLSAQAQQDVKAYTWEARARRILQEAGLNGDS